MTKTKYEHSIDVGRWHLVCDHLAVLRFFVRARYSCSLRVGVQLMVCSKQLRQTEFFSLFYFHMDISHPKAAWNQMIMKLEFWKQ